MKELETSIDYTKELKRLFTDFNNHYWDGKLPDVFFTISPTRGAHGHFTAYEAWQNDENGDGKYEINISAITISRPPEEVSATLLHEMCHLSNFIQNIPDCSNHGRYHNRRFKEEAESHGLICSKDDTYGWSHTTLNDEAKKYCSKINIKPFQYRRVDPNSKRRSKIKYVCPNAETSEDCKRNSVWANHAVKLICAYCGAELVPDLESSKPRTDHE